MTAIRSEAHTHASLGGRGSVAPRTQKGATPSASTRKSKVASLRSEPLSPKVATPSPRSSVTNLPTSPAAPRTMKARAEALSALRGTRRPSQAEAPDEGWREHGSPGCHEYRSGEGG